MEENVKNIDKNSTNIPPKIEYVRPFDRSPDKDFHQRTEYEKKIICYNRAMKVKVKDKIDRLQNEVEEREKEVHTEKKLRQEAEDKLKACLQDMYSKKEVNQELRERLPRANKSDPFKTTDNDISETDLSSIEEQIVVEEEDSKSSSKPKLRSEEQKSLESQVVREKKGKSAKSPRASPKHSPKSSPKSSRRNLNFSGDRRSSSSPQNEAEFQSNMERSSTYPFSNTSPPLRGFYGHPYGASPYMPYSLLSGNYPGLSANLGNPLLHSTSLLPPSAMQRPMSSPALNSSLLGGSGLLERPLSQSVSAPTMAGAASLNTSATDGQTTTTTGATGGQSSQSSPDSGLGASANFSGYYRHYFPTQRAGHTSLLPDPPFIASGSPRLHMGTGTSLGAGAGTSLDPDQNKHITSLLSEIDSQKQETRKLKNELQDKETEIETLKLTLKAKGVDQNTELSNAHKAADLVEEVYAAQKKRDDATVARMKIANEERDDILARLQQLETRLDSHRDESSMFLDRSDIDIQMDDEQIDNEDMYLLLSRLDSPSSGENEAATLMKKVETMRQRQREVTREEMQIVMEQRDIALAKCRKLEEELLRYQKESDADGGMDKSIKTEAINIRFAPSPPPDPVSRPNLPLFNKKGTWQLPNPNNLTTKFRRYVFTTACTSPSPLRTPSNSRPTTPSTPTKKSSV
ncbi:uncharacterized protein LOC123535213 isoform X2 [Mercenaria mercenaria]|uniref:uncharacterized protein LOC123535213 isoform X2 n=1 Tax=Mercenaria mercenaria TaxID=6596 RepID=UPI00234F8A7E|nr:uncharacterized protein LOC123535213 isoform X2 [Mercenaria mercenaria]